MSWPRLWRPLAVLAFLVGSVWAFRGCTADVDPEYCDTDAECQARNGGRAAVCNAVHHFCMNVPDSGVLCSSDTACELPDRPACDQTRATCVPCTAREGVANECTHLKLNYCINKNGGTTCVECRSSQECPSDRPICDANKCRPCAEHHECAGPHQCSDGQPCTDSLVCIGKDDLPGSTLGDLAGRCAATGERAVSDDFTVGGLVVYVQGGVGMGCSDMNSGTTQGSPRCTLDAAMGKARQDHRPYVRLLSKGGTLAPPMAAIDGAANRLVLVGAPVAAGETARAKIGAALAGPILDVRNGALITLDQVEVRQDTPGQTALRCNVATLRVRRSWVSGSTVAAGTGAGILVQDCPGVLVERSYVGAARKGDPSHAFGLSILGTSECTLRGNIIAGNTAAGIVLSNMNQATVNASFNTITQNPQGLTCPMFAGGQLSFTASIIAGNTADIANAANCTFTNVVTGATKPVLGPDFHLLDPVQNPINGTCCVDQIPAASGLPDRDIDNQARPYPKDGKWDIGADEYAP